MKYLHSLLGQASLLALVLTPSLQNVMAQTQAAAPAVATSVQTQSSSTRWKVGAKVYNEYNRDKAHKFNDLDIEMQPSVGYKLTDQDALSLTPIIRITDKKGKYRDESVEALEFKLKRSKILTEAQNGVDMSAEIRSAYHADSRYRMKKNSYGYNQVRLTNRKNFGPLMVETTLRYDIFMEKEGQLNQTKRMSKIYLFPEYHFTDTVSVSSCLTYVHRDYAPKSTKDFKKDDYIEWTPSLNYYVKKDFMISLYSELTPVTAHDHRSIARKYGDNGNIGLLIDATFL